MFGLEGQKKKKVEEFFFDLEKELQNPGEIKKMLETINERLHTIKGCLREGGSQDEVNQFGTLLNGYISLMKVVTRSKNKKIPKENKQS